VHQFKIKIKIVFIRGAVIKIDLTLLDFTHMNLRICFIYYISCSKATDGCTVSMLRTGLRHGHPGHITAQRGSPSTVDSRLVSISVVTDTTKVWLTTTVRLPATRDLC